MEQQLELPISSASSDLDRHDEKVAEPEHRSVEIEPVKETSHRPATGKQPVDDDVASALERHRKGAASENDFRLLHKVFFKPGLDSGQSILYGSPEHIARSAEYRSQAEAAVKAMVERGERPTKAKIRKLAAVPESTAAAVIRNHHNSEVLAKRRNDKL